MKGIGVYPGKFVHNLDHLVPLCQLMDVPILCTDPWIKEMIELYYPKMDIYLDEAPDYSLERFLKDFDTFFYIDHFRKHHGSFQFYQYFYSGRARSLCALHGNSDKKRNLHWIEKFCDEDVSLIYGQHMIDFLDEKDCINKLHKCLLGGNYRREYYLAHEEFFDEKVKRFLFPKSNMKTILYAPTWTHPIRGNTWREDFSNFFDVYNYVLGNLPENMQMMVKLHPNMLEFVQDEVDEIKEKYARENIIFIEEMPLIYPLLKHVDAYLGDYSSIGYDFLSFNRPLFFMSDGVRLPENDKGVYLYTCGTSIMPQNYEELYSIISCALENDAFHARRKEMYTYAFGERKELSILKKEISEALL